MIGCGNVLKIDMDGINLAEVEALVDITEQFVVLAEKLLDRGEISQEEYRSMTSLKRKFLEDMRTKYL